MSPQRQEWNVWKKTRWLLATVILALALLQAQLLRNASNNSNFGNDDSMTARNSDLPKLSSLASSSSPSFKRTKQETQKMQSPPHSTRRTNETRPANKNAPPPPISSNAVDKSNNNRNNNHHNNNNKKNTIHVDNTTIPYHYYHQPLRNDYLLQNFTTPPPIGIDAVVLASTIDATLAISIHNLYHLIGIRRFVIIVNNATRDCREILDLIPNHHYHYYHQNDDDSERHNHLCLEHADFYTPPQLRHLTNNYPLIHRGAKQKNKRGNQHVHVSRFGWYLQQFSKYLVSRLVPDLSQPYLAIDGDLIVTRPFDLYVNGTFTNNETTLDNNNNNNNNSTTIAATTRKWIMPQTSKDPKQWKYFVDLILGNQTTNHNSTQQKVGSNKNFVVGWMILDQTIVMDLIDTINRQLKPLGGNYTTTTTDDDKSTDYAATFPWNILDYAERGMDDGKWFSEFYLYARFALQKYPNYYQRQSFGGGEPTRNKGKFQYTCQLTRNVMDGEYADYYFANNNKKRRHRPPWLIWEEHKQHAYNACPDAPTSEELTRLLSIGIWHDFHKPPWGGGNQFLLALRNGLQDHWNTTVLVKSDETINTTTTTATTPQPQGKQILESSQVLLANSITFKGGMGDMKNLQKKNQLALVHRVDGPYYVARYFQPLNFTPPLPRNKLPQEDKKTLKINKDLACATIFQSTWSFQANVKIGLNLKNPVVISNTVDPNIFYPKVLRNDDNTTKLPWEQQGNRKIIIVATSHSDNIRKGFDTMMWLDEHLNFEKYDFWYMGGKPKWFQPKHAKVFKGTGSMAVADFLRSGDLYFAPSRYEPASNAVLEALACGLPVLYQMGSSHGDLVQGGGMGFSATAGGEQQQQQDLLLLDRLESLVDNYQDYVDGIRVPTIQEVSRQYLAIMRWCFYMKRLL